MRSVTETSLNAIDASVGAESDAIDASFLVAGSVQIISTGSPSGDVKVQASNDLVTGSQVPTNWTDITGLSVTLSGAGTDLIPKFDICYQSIRIVATAGGTGTVTAKFKGVGF
jgi:hypothetical protein